MSWFWPWQDGSHAEDVTLHFQHHGGELIADLRINDALLPRGHFLKYQRPSRDGGGYVLLNEFNRTTAALCHYKVSELVLCGTGLVANVWREN